MVGRANLNIIGISAGYHDSACCLMQNGKVLAAAQEERFSRKKNDEAFPVAAFGYCLDEAGLTIADIDCVAFYEDPIQKTGRQIWMGMLPDLPPQRRAAVLRRALGSRPQDTIRETLGFAGPIEIVDHHLSHAASAYYFSGFEEAAILTVDGVGEWRTTTYSSASGAAINRFAQTDFPDSLGLFYSAITGYLGFEVNEGEYKVMGLAPYGQPKYASAMRELVVDEPQGGYRLNLDYFAFMREDKMFSDNLCRLLGAPPRPHGAPITQFHMDVARSAQLVLEDILLAKVRYLNEQAPSKNLCMAGGVALNVVANARCLKEGPFENLFVQPAAGDAGGSLGAAAMAHVRATTARPNQERLQHVYLGPRNTSEEVRHILDASGVSFSDYCHREDDLVDDIVTRLIAGQVIAWVYGRMEFGPRALGARSILADPRRPEMKDRINALVKQREAFRPFAPAVLETHAAEHFALRHASPFMLETCEVTSKLALPSITHVDGSARVQTVSEATSPRFAKLLEHFYRRTSCPILLNTSLNLRGEPIVCSVMDAISTFGRSQMDALVLEDYMIDRKNIPRVWERYARGSRDDGERKYAVYTMF